MYVSPQHNLNWAIIEIKAKECLHYMLNNKHFSSYKLKNDLSSFRLTRLSFMATNITKIGFAIDKVSGLGS